MTGKLDITGLTDGQAYRAMLLFLERQYALTGSDDLGSLLGSASLMTDGEPADPAMRQEWLDCLTAAVGSGREAAE